MKKIFLALLGVLWSSLAFAQNDAQQRYVGLQLLNLDPRPEAGLDLIETAVQQGCNLVALTIQWDEVYKSSTSAADWRQYDRQIEYLAKTNAKIALRIIVGRLNYRLDGFWTDNETMKDELGRPLKGVYDRTCFSFSHAPTAEKAQKFIVEVCERYNQYQNQGKILYISFGNLPTQELGFSHENQFGNEKSYLASFDYSQPSIEAYRKWASTYYKTIQKLNYLCKTKFTSFQNLVPPRTIYNPLPSYQLRQGKDWYVFLHSQLKGFVDNTVTKIKQFNPTYKIVNEFGTVTEDFSAMLVSYGFRNLSEKVEGIKVHDDPYYDHRWITDVLRSNADGKWVLNEVFYNPQVTNDQLLRQFDECFQHGSKIVTFVISTVEDRTSQLMKIAAQRWVDVALVPNQPPVKLSASLTEALDSTLKNAYKRWYSLYSSTLTPITIKLEEDILSEDYWRILGANVYPVVANPIIDRATKPKKTYSYTLPKDVFLDPDGEIVTVEVLEKPQWLNFSNGTLTGVVPDQLGESKIVLRAIDNEGATVQTSFLLKIVNVNQKPVVKRTLPDFESSLNQTISYPIQGDIFDDPDGVIVRTQATGLRPWMSFNSKEFSAYPQEQGTFTITLRGIDDDSAYAETSFKVKILNRTPTVKQLLPEKTIAQNKAFRFKVPTSIFTDPDGEITKVKAVGLPTWLTYDAPTSTLKGTPTELGVYKVGIRAYDNGGDSVETAFVIKVDLYGTQNVPPVLRYTIPDAQLYVTQRFSYKVSDSLFYDTNGYVDRIEAPNLPAWLTFKNNELTGVATASGTYTVALRGVDDDETSTTTTFKIVVKQAQMSFELIQAGKAGQRRSMGLLNEGDVLSEATLPQRITMYANSEAPATKVNFVLRGPYSKTFTATRFPFSLFDEELGFVPIAGRYRLEATAYSDSAKVSAASIQFTVKATQAIQEWEVYPNPCFETFVMKVPNSVVFNGKLTLIAQTGQSTTLTFNKDFWVSDGYLYVDLRNRSLPQGSYFLITEANGEVRTVKFGKL